MFRELQLALHRVLGHVVPKPPEPPEMCFVLTVHHVSTHVATTCDTIHHSARVPLDPPDLLAERLGGEAPDVPVLPVADPVEVAAEDGLGLAGDLEHVATRQGVRPGLLHNFQGVAVGRSDTPVVGTEPDPDVERVRERRRTDQKAPIDDRRALLNSYSIPFGLHG